MFQEPLFLGIDIGTSGCRAIVINHHGAVVAETKQRFTDPDQNGKKIQQDPEIWWHALETALEQLSTLASLEQVKAIAVDGTSSTVILCDQRGKPLYPALMYNDTRSTVEAERLAQMIPKASAAHGPSSGLAKMLWLQRCVSSEQTNRILHQTDWIVGRLTGRFDLSDPNNCLKMGYDSINGVWPDWMRHTGAFCQWLPTPQPSGNIIGPISSATVKRWGFSPQTVMVAGTTDSTAAFIATGASQPGEAVTSLGSTLVMKVIATSPIFAPEYGVYSQPLGRLWLVGGGSNSGGRVLRHYFSNQQLTELSAHIDPNSPSGLDYYPLLFPGERFPIADANLPPRLTPKPKDDVQFLQGLLEGMAAIEKQAYLRLTELGALYPTSLRSAGGGASNEAWRTIRQNRLGVDMIAANHLEAAYGSALLARKPFLKK